MGLLEGNRPSNLPEDDISYAGLRGRQVIIMQGYGGESSSLIQGTVDGAMPPKGGAKFWTIRLKGVLDVIVVDPEITCVTVLNEKDN